MNFAAVLSRCLQDLIAKRVYRRLRIKLVGNRAERENENLSVINARLTMMINGINGTPVIDNFPRDILKMLNDEPRLNYCYNGHKICR